MTTANNAQEECNLLSSLTESLTSTTATSNNPYQQAALTCATFILLTFTTSTITKNYSQVDKLWSITPCIYAWLAVCDHRTLLMAIVTTIWGVRLTWNFARRGGYKFPQIWHGEEDYRWEIIQKGGFVPILTHPTIWVLFNFGFISVYQNMLLFFMVAPSYVAYTVATSPGCRARVAPLNWLDVVAALGCITFVIVESIADNQQFSFQSKKHALMKASLELPPPYRDGFCQSGLYAVVRKPNYAAEQCIWICYYVFSIAAFGENNKVIVWNWSGMGFVQLMVLFQVSGWFTERISRDKYPKYEEYRKKVPLYVPCLFRRVVVKRD